MHVLKGRIAKGRRKLEIAASTCPTTFIEHQPAVAEPKRLKL